MLSISSEDSVEDDSLDEVVLFSPSSVLSSLIVSVEESIFVLGSPSGSAAVSLNFLVFSSIFPSASVLTRPLSPVFVQSCQRSRTQPMRFLILFPVLVKKPEILPRQVLIAPYSLFLIVEKMPLFSTVSREARLVPSASVLSLPSDVIVVFLPSLSVRVMSPLSLSVPPCCARPVSNCWTVVSVLEISPALIFCWIVLSSDLERCEFETLRELNSSTRRLTSANGRDAWEPSNNPPKPRIVAKMVMTGAAFLKFLPLPESLAGFFDWPSDFLPVTLFSNLSAVCVGESEGFLPEASLVAESSAPRRNFTALFRSLAWLSEPSCDASGLKLGVILSLMGCSSPSVT